MNKRLVALARGMALAFLLCILPSASADESLVLGEVLVKHTLSTSEGLVLATGEGLDQSDLSVEIDGRLVDDFVVVAGCLLLVEVPVGEPGSFSLRVRGGGYEDHLERAGERLSPRADLSIIHDVALSLMAESRDALDPALLCIATGLMPDWEPGRFSKEFLDVRFQSLSRGFEDASRLISENIEAIARNAVALMDEIVLAEPDEPRRRGLEGQSRGLSTHLLQEADRSTSHIDKQRRSGDRAHQAGQARGICL